MSEVEYEVETVLDYLAKKHYQMPFNRLCGPRKRTIRQLAEQDKIKHEQQLNEQEV